jgi:hypothetical protein
LNRAEFTGIKALAAFQTLLKVDNIGRTLFVGIFGSLGLGNAVGRTLFGAGAAADTLDRIDYKAHELLAFTGTALLVPDVFQVLFPEIFNR